MMNNFTGTERVNQSGCPRFCPGCHDPFLLPTDRLAEKEQYIKKVLSSWHDRKPSHKRCRLSAA